MSCDEIVSKLNREVTEEAKARFANLRGSCLGVVDRDGELFMHTKVVVRRATRSTLTLYVPATDRTFDIQPDPAARVVIDGRRVRPANLPRGQELSIHIPVDEFTEPVIDQVAFLTDVEEEIIIAPATIRARTLPTTG